MFPHMREERFGGIVIVFGLLKDIKNGEYRTIATPVEISTIVADGHTALVQRGGR